MHLMCKLQNHTNYKTIKEGIFMFKKLLVVGALVSGIALTGGIGTALAIHDCPPDDVNVIDVDSSGVLYQTYITVRHYDNFSNVFTRYEPKFNKVIKWYFKEYDSDCDDNGTPAYAARYQGREAN